MQRNDQKQVEDSRRKRNQFAENRNASPFSFQKEEVHPLHGIPIQNSNIRIPNTPILIHQTSPKFKRPEQQGKQIIIPSNDELPLVDMINTYGRMEYNIMNCKEWGKIKEQNNGDSQFCSFINSYLRSDEIFVDVNLHVQSQYTIKKGVHASGKCQYQMFENDFSLIKMVPFPTLQLTDLQQSSELNRKENKEITSTNGIFQSLNLSYMTLNKELLLWQAFGSSSIHDMQTALVSQPCQQGLKQCQKLFRFEEDITCIAYGRPKIQQFSYQDIGEVMVIAFTSSVRFYSLKLSHDEDAIELVDLNMPITMEPGIIIHVIHFSQDGHIFLGGNDGLVSELNFTKPTIFGVTNPLAEDKLKMIQPKKKNKVYYGQVLSKLFRQVGGFLQFKRITSLYYVKQIETDHAFSLLYSLNINVREREQQHSLQRDWQVQVYDISETIDSRLSLIGELSKEQLVKQLVDKRIMSYNSAETCCNIVSIIRVDRLQSKEVHLILVASNGLRIYVHFETHESEEPLNSNGEVIDMFDQQQLVTVKVTRLRAGNDFGFQVVCIKESCDVETICQLAAMECQNQQIADKVSKYLAIDAGEINSQDIDHIFQSGKMDGESFFLHVSGQKASQQQFKYNIFVSMSLNLQQIAQYKDCTALMIPSNIKTLENICILKIPDNAQNIYQTLANQISPSNNAMQIQYLQYMYNLSQHVKEQIFEFTDKQLINYLPMSNNHSSEHLEMLLRLGASPSKLQKSWLAASPNNEKQLPLQRLDDLTRQTYLPPKHFLLTTKHGNFVFVKHRPVDHLVATLRIKSLFQKKKLGAHQMQINEPFNRQKGDERQNIDQREWQSVCNFIQAYGVIETAAMLTQILTQPLAMYYVNLKYESFIRTRIQMQNTQQQQQQQANYEQYQFEDAVSGVKATDIMQLAKEALFFISQIDFTASQQNIKDQQKIAIKNLDNFEQIHYQFGHQIKNKENTRKGRTAGIMLYLSRLLRPVWQVTLLTNNSNLNNNLNSNLNQSPIFDPSVTCSRFKTNDLCYIREMIANVLAFLDSNSAQEAYQLACELGQIKRQYIQQQENEQYGSASPFMSNFYPKQVQDSHFDQIQFNDKSQYNPFICLFNLIHPKIQNNLALNQETASAADLLGRMAGLAQQAEQETMNVMRGTLRKTIEALNLCIEHFAYGKETIKDALQVSLGEQDQKDIQNKQHIMNHALMNMSEQDLQGVRNLTLCDFVHESPLIQSEGMARFYTFFSNKLQVLYKSGIGYDMVKQFCLYNSQSFPTFLPESQIAFCEAEQNLLYIVEQQNKTQLQLQLNQEEAKNQELYNANMAQLSGSLKSAIEIIGRNLLIFDTEKQIKFLSLFIQVSSFPEFMQLLLKRASLLQAWERDILNDCIKHNQNATNVQVYGYQQQTDVSDNENENVKTKRDSLLECQHLIEKTQRFLINLLELFNVKLPGLPAHGLHFKSLPKYLQALSQHDKKAMGTEMVSQIITSDLQNSSICQAVAQYVIFESPLDAILHQGGPQMNKAIQEILNQPIEDIQFDKLEAWALKRKELHIFEKNYSLAVISFVQFIRRFIFCNQQQYLPVGKEKIRNYCSEAMNLLASNEIKIKQPLSQLNKEHLDQEIQFVSDLQKDIQIQEMAENVISIHKVIMIKMLEMGNQSSQFQHKLSLHFQTLLSEKVQQTEKDIDIYQTILFSKVQIQALHEIPEVKMLISSSSQNCTQEDIIFQITQFFKVLRCRYFFDNNEQQSISLQLLCLAVEMHMKLIEAFFFQYLSEREQNYFSNEILITTFIQGLTGLFCENYNYVLETARASSISNQQQTQLISMVTTIEAQILIPLCKVSYRTLFFLHLAIFKQLSQCFLYKNESSINLNILCKNSSYMFEGMLSILLISRLWHQFESLNRVNQQFAQLQLLEPMQSVIIWMKDQMKFNMNLLDYVDILSIEIGHYFKFQQYPTKDILSNLENDNFQMLLKFENTIKLPPGLDLLKKQVKTIPIQQPMQQQNQQLFNQQQKNQSHSHQQQQQQIDVLQGNVSTDSEYMNNQQQLQQYMKPGQFNILGMLQQEDEQESTEIMNNKQLYSEKSFQK